LELEQLTVGDIVSRTAGLSTVDADAGATEIQAQSRRTHHQRILVRGEDQAVVGVVHVRDTLRARDGSTAGDVMRPVLRLTADTPVYKALQTMRQTRNHLALIVDGDAVVGLITLTDVMQRLLPAA
jgi:CBS domain containing-hemolysin-like protein